MHTYRDLLVWQKSIELVIEIYALTDQFPKEEIYGLISQMKRSSVSIPSNIAEGRLRGSTAEWRRYLFIAYGSGGELETQIEIAKKLPKTKDLKYIKVDGLLVEIMKMLNKLISHSNSIIS